MTLFKMNGTDYSPFLVGEVNYDKSQIWADGSGRELDKAKWIGNVLNNFTNLEVEIAVQDATMLSNIETVLNSGSITIEYWSTELMQVVTKVFYRSNYKVVLQGFYDEGSNQLFDTLKLQFIAHEGNR